MGAGRNGVPGLTALQAAGLVPNQKVEHVRHQNRLEQEHLVQGKNQMKKRARQLHALVYKL